MSTPFSARSHPVLMAGLLWATQSIAFSTAAHAQPSPVAASGPAAQATDASTAAAHANEMARPQAAHTDIGHATHELLALQRASQGSGPRFIDGAQASRSYQRYLKSFESPIPDQYDTGLQLKK